jgi:ATPase family associated with various cellular activities (AAA)
MMKQGDSEMIRFNTTKNKFEGFVNGNVVVRNAKEQAVRNYLKRHHGVVCGAVDTPAIANAKSTDSDFSINERFEFVTDLVTMVANRQTPSAVITGEGGLGKTFTVLKALNDSGLKDMSELQTMEVGAVVRLSKMFVVVKGFSTAKGLFRTLYENRESVIVFDDCDSVLRDPVALNLLKAALDSYDKRIISYNADIRDEDLPRSFLFNGSVIFISNLSQDRLDQAIRSRSMNVDLSMNTAQKCERMRTLITLPEFMPEFSVAQKNEAMDLIEKHKDAARELSLRSLIKITKIRASNSPNWEKLARYVLVN